MKPLLSLLATFVVLPIFALLVAYYAAGALRCSDGGRRRHEQTDQN